jgi:predicted dehydrogenase
VGNETIRVGIVGAGANTRLRHVPGFRRIPGVEIRGVVNRSAESTRRAADEFQVPKIYDHWQQLVADPEIDAVMIGTWPYLHCPITLAALEAGKHVLTEARMARNADEAHRMLAAAHDHPDLVTQIVPSPFGFRPDRVIKELVAEGFLGELREIVALSADDSLADANAPLHWRQVAELSGLNMLHLGILFETTMRWVPDVAQVLAQTTAFTAERRDPDSGTRKPVGTPDSVQVLTRHVGGAQGIYHLSGVTRFGPGRQIHLYGSEGTIKYLDAPQEKLVGARAGEKQLREILIPAEKAYSWRVEEEFIAAIRGLETVEFTDFATGGKYMEFTEAVARSANEGRAIALPLADLS